MPQYVGWQHRHAFLPEVEFHDNLFRLLVLRRRSGGSDIHGTGRGIDNPCDTHCPERRGRDSQAETR